MLAAPARRLPRDNLRYRAEPELTAELQLTCLLPTFRWGLTSLGCLSYTGANARVDSEKSQAASASQGRVNHPRPRTSLSLRGNLTAHSPPLGISLGGFEGRGHHCNCSAGKQSQTPLHSTEGRSTLK